MLLHELDQTFSDVVYPGDEALADSYPNEWESTLKRLHGKDWRAVTIDDFDSQGGIMEGIQALSVKGFIYFLPGLTHISLTEPNNRYVVVSTLLTRFTIPDYLPESAAKPKEAVKMLSATQRDFLVRFFSLMQESETALCPIVVDSAIFNLKAGDIFPYKQENVKKWVSSFS